MGIEYRPLINWQCVHCGGLTDTDGRCYCGINLYASFDSHKAKTRNVAGELDETSQVSE